MRRTKDAYPTSDIIAARGVRILYAHNSIHLGAIDVANSVPDRMVAGLMSVVVQDGVCFFLDAVQV